MGAKHSSGEMSKLGERLAEINKYVGKCLAGNGDLQQFVQYMSQLAEASPEDAAVDLELCARDAFRKIAAPLTVDQILAQNSPVRAFLGRAIELGLQLGNKLPAAAKLPYVLLEDLVDSQSVRHSRAIWQIVEDLLEALTEPLLFLRGRLTILRMCNTLLKKLSRAQETEFCGRILMFLAAIYPLTERSAVNLRGLLNAKNVTEFADDAEFAAATANTAEDDPASFLHQDPQAVAILNSFRVQEGDEEKKSELPEKKRKEEQEEGVVMEGEEEEAKPLDYNLYRTFWHIQSILTTSSADINTTEKAQEMMASFDNVLSLLEGTTFSELEVVQAAAKRSNEKAAAAEQAYLNVQETEGNTSMEMGSDEQQSYFGCKYLTSAQLFHLQLHDPFIRMQMLLQLLIYFQSLKAKPPQVDWHPEELKPLEERVYKLIEGIPSVGEDFARSVRNVLHREVHWLDWKTSSCPQFEKEPAPLVRKRKRPAEQEMKLNGSSAIASALEVANMPISEIADALEENVPSYQRQVAPYEEAMDPESGIEEEYHPKHDKVYCWRTLRVISNSHLAAFGEPTTGPQDLLEKAVKFIKQPRTTEAEPHHVGEAEAEQVRIELEAVRQEAEAELAAVQPGDEPSGETEMAVAGEDDQGLETKEEGEA